MKQIRTFPHLRPHHGQHGFSMIELVVAMVVAVFLLAGLFTVLQGNMDTSTEQTALAQLQDNERFAMQIYTNMIESAGYYPTLSPAGAQNVSTVVLPVDGTTNGTFQTAGQGLTGGSNGSGGDMLMSRFMTNPGDGVSSCLGRTTPTTGSPTIYKNQLQVDATTNTLKCSDGNGVSSVALVSGVQNVTLLWGVNTQATTANSNCPANAYLATADYLNLSPLLQTSVCMVQVTLTFTNPLYQLTPGGRVTPGQQKLPTIQFTKVIAVMVKAGP
jgi:type IV pilus assembly protein PilW